MKKILALLAMLIFTGCAAHSSPQQTLVDDRYLVYKETYKAYAEAEADYLNLLFNLERMPEEKELWVMKRDKMQELMQLRELMLNSRTELDNAMQDWERHLTDLQNEMNPMKIRMSPNFRGEDARRTSPGQLLPGEVKTKKKNTY